MRIVRFADTEGVVHVGLGDGDADTGELRALPGVRRVADLLQLPLARMRERVDWHAGDPATHRIEEVTVLPPIDGHTEVWASGVTYERSREARVAESDGRAIYDLVYDAARPELFFKALPWRVVTEAEPIAVRADSDLDVPEPELALVVNAHGEVVGYSVCDDVSSRSIEGENALYLPQAKVYAGSCALGAAITPVWAVADIAAEHIHMRIGRGGRDAFSGSIPLTALRRDPAELVDYLFRGQPFPDGAVLATGTGIVPDMDFTLRAGDLVDIEITGVGRLRNPVVCGPSELEWLVAARDQPAARQRVTG